MCSRSDLGRTCQADSTGSADPTCSTIRPAHFRLRRDTTCGKVLSSQLFGYQNIFIHFVHKNIFVTTRVGVFEFGVGGSMTSTLLISVTEINKNGIDFGRSQRSQNCSIFVKNVKNRRFFQMYRRWDFTWVFRPPKRGFSRGSPKTTFLGVWGVYQTGSVG
jgi:hypothetical protein